MSRALEYTCACIALSTHAASALARPSAQARPVVPLAYVRRIVVAQVSVQLSGPHEEAPVPAKRRPTARLDRADPAQTAGLCRLGASRLDDALRLGLGGLGGFAVASERPIVTASESLEAGLPQATITEVGRMATAASADAVLIVRVDRFGVRTAFFREVWFRAVAFVVTVPSGDVRGPVYAVGAASTAPRLVRAGFMRDDAALAADAATDAANRLVRALDKGEQAPFSADTRVAVIPASVPETADFADRTGRVVERFAVPALARQADVLFQPDIGPVAVGIEPDAVVAGLAGSGLRTADVWTGDAPDIMRTARVGLRLGADYVFLSRVRAASVGPFEADDGSESVGDVAEVLADFALVRPDGRQALWRTQQSGSARSHIVAPEGPRRIRTREQCVMDAAVAAYAHGRFALEEWTRRRRN